MSSFLYLLSPRKGGETAFGGSPPFIFLPIRGYHPPLNAAAGQGLEFVAFKTF